MKFNEVQALRNRKSRRRTSSLERIDSRFPKIYLKYLDLEVCQDPFRLF